MERAFPEAQGKQEAVGVLRAQLEKAAGLSSGLCPSATHAVASGDCPHGHLFPLKSQILSMFVATQALGSSPTGSETNKNGSE